MSFYCRAIERVRKTTDSHVSTMYKIFILFLWAVHRFQRHYCWLFGITSIEIAVEKHSTPT